jgi:hypothetical protein
MKRDLPPSHVCNDVTCGMCDDVTCDMCDDVTCGMCDDVTCDMCDDVTDMVTCPPEQRRHHE